MTKTTRSTIDKIMNKIKNFSILMIVFSIIDILLILIIIFSYYFTFLVDSKRVIFIPKGSTSYIITYLDKNEYSLNSLDYMLIKKMGYPQSGWIDLKDTTMTKYDFLYKLTKSKAALVNITLIPGETYYYFLQDLATKLKIPINEVFDTYAKLAYKKDGNILSQTYALPIGMNVNDLITYLFDYTNNQYKKYSEKIFGHYNKEKWYKYITLASIVQKESASKEEMPKIASVIYNRLEKNMPLQMDGTLNYGKNSHKKITPKMIRTNKTNYNTYKNKGIPSHPICAVEFESIKAAIFPLKTDYLYFMKAVDGKKHLFSKKYNTHKKNIKKVKDLKRKSHQNKTKKRNTKKKKYKQKSKQVKAKRQLKDIWKSVY